MEVNLYDEIVEKLKDNGYTVDDILAVVCDDFNINIDNFIDVAKRTNYDSGFGVAEIAKDLKIIMRDGSWFERKEHDGSEWFSRVIPPKLHERTREIIRVRILPDDYLTKVADMNPQQ